MERLMSHRILLGLCAAASVLIATQAIADPRPHRGIVNAPRAPMHGFAAGTKRMHGHAHRFGAGWGWPAYALPESQYLSPSAGVVLDERRDFYRCDYIDCVYGYHPLGYYDPRPSGDAGYAVVIPPDAKIISLDQVDK
jgi:hypothetical protein